MLLLKRERPISSAEAGLVPDMIHTPTEYTYCLYHIRGRLRTVSKAIIMNSGTIQPAFCTLHGAIQCLRKYFESTQSSTVR